MRRNLIFRSFTLLLACLLPLLAVSSWGAEEGEEAITVSYPVMRGAALGYVADKVCATCHADEAATYQDVGMHNSFYQPTSKARVEDFSQGFTHAASGQHFRFEWRGDQLIFHRFQLDGEGQPINQLDIRVDWVMGSGKHVRTYLYQTPNGEIFELPVSWYAQSSSWQMSPGFDRPDHQGVTRSVMQECMFCHNAYPEVSVGNDALPPAHVYPESLPEGIGCQRCHGPGARHVGLASSVGSQSHEVQESIVNPAKLSGELRHAICLSCHLLPSVAVPGIHRFDTAAYSFVPGQALGDYALALDVDDADQAAGDRFEIDHHAYRLLQSKCFAASKGNLSCLTCHNPHKIVAESERAAHYAAICAKCHQEEGFTAKHTQQVTAWRSAQPPTPREIAEEDCVACHMPERRTQDVIHVTMTDHMIRRIPMGVEALAPIPEREPIIEDIRLLFPAQETDPGTWDLYRTIATLRAVNWEHTDALNHLEGIFAARSVPEIEPYLDLARAQFTMGRIANARQTLTEILRRAPGMPQALKWLGECEIRDGNNASAAELFAGAAKSSPDWAEVQVDLGRAQFLGGRMEEAKKAIEKAIEMRPNSALAWYILGRIGLDAGEAEKAEEHFKLALAHDPGLGEAYVRLADALIAAERPDEAQRYLKHGASHARDTAKIEARLSPMAQTVSVASP